MMNDVWINSSASYFAAAASAAAASNQLMVAIFGPILLKFYWYECQSLRNDFKHLYLCDRVFVLLILYCYSLLLLLLNISRFTMSYAYTRTLSHCIWATHSIWFLFSFFPFFVFFIEVKHFSFFFRAAFIAWYCRIFDGSTFEMIWRLICVCIKLCRNFDIT